MSDLQAVFWDMDGTLVDTEPYWIESEYDLVQAHSGTWSQDHAQQMVGQALDYTAVALQDAGVRLPVKEIIDRLTADVARRCAQRIPWRPGARELLQELHAAEVPCALVTMSFKPLAEAIVSALKPGSFEVMITGDMVCAGKPDPEAYHRAFKTLEGTRWKNTGVELDRTRCVAIEDSVPGTAAAVASGLVTVAVPHYSVLPEQGDWHQLETLEGVCVSDLDALLHKPTAVCL